MPKKPRSVSTPAAALGSTKKSKSAASKKQKDEKMALDSSADLDEVPVSADSDVADVEPKEEQQSVPKNMPTHPNLQADQVRLLPRHIFSFGISVLLLLLLSNIRAIHNGV